MRIAKVTKRGFYLLYFRMPNEYFKNLPKKRMASGILLFNEQNELLLLKPTYKNDWSIPGGVVEENESPFEAAIRETFEEIGLQFSDLKFLCVEYIHADGDFDENLQFIFSGGRLSMKEINTIKLRSEEHSEFKFINVPDALALLGVRLAKRLPFALKALETNVPLYIES